MAFQVSKSGSKGKWRLLFQAPGVRRNVPVDSAEARAAGFYPNMTFDEARARQVALKGLGRVASEEGARARARRGALNGAAFLSKYQAAGFVEVMARKKIRVPHWATMQRLIVRMPHASAWTTAAFYALMAEFRFSPSYAKKLRNYMNHWGHYLSRQEGFAFDPLTRPLATEARGLRLNVKRAPGRSTPLTPAGLAALKAKLPAPQHLWLSFSVWFGLRPREVDNLAKRNPELWELEPEALAVFQQKLLERNVPEDKCWKWVTLRFPEQRALAARLGEPLERPSNRALSRLQPGLTCYGGRAAFVDLLKSRGVDLLACRDEMGHRSIVTTEVSYEGRVRRRG
jgi:integrase